MNHCRLFKILYNDKATLQKSEVALFIIFLLHYFLYFTIAHSNNIYSVLQF